jgi:hypothetical protein
MEAIANNDAVLAIGSSKEALGIVPKESATTSNNVRAPLVPEARVTPLGRKHYTIYMAIYNILACILFTQP